MRQVHVTGESLNWYVCMHVCVYLCVYVMQVVTGDSWASGITRSLFTENPETGIVETDPAGRGWLTLEREP